MDKTEDKTYYVNSRILTFGIVSVLVLIICICGGLLVFLHSMSSKYIDQRERNTELQQTINDLRRSLDHAQGRLFVFDNFLINNRRATGRRLIHDFTHEMRKNPEDMTLDQFEKWILELEYKTGQSGDFGSIKY